MSEGAGKVNKRPIIIALDFEDRKKVQSFLQNFHEPLYVKVGMELYFQEGPSILSYLKDEGHQIFLDLKLHDIPNTVKQAMTGLARIGVDMVNVHALGGRNMMEAALEGLEIGTQSNQTRPTLIAVTQLTSTNDQMLRDDLNIHSTVLDSVIHLAEQTKSSGLDGVVCSTHEVERIREACGDEFQTVTPGIRMKEDQHNDQVRVATPCLARKKGATAIVVGRSITKANDPYRAYVSVKQEWESEMNETTIG